MESLLKFVNTPFRLFCTMLVLYMAAHSHVIAVVVGIVFLSVIWHSLKNEKNAPIPAAPSVILPKLEKAEADKVAPAVRPAANTARYAKSAVVTPMLHPKAATRP